MSGGKGDKEKSSSSGVGGGGLSETPPAVSSVKGTHVVSATLRDKVKRLFPDNPDAPDNARHRDRTIKALEAGKVVHVGVHKLKADKIKDSAG